MHTFMDAKLMAKLLRQALAERQVEIGHSEALEIVARQFGLADWNILSARIEAAARPATARLPDGWLKTGQNSGFFEAGIDPADGTVLIESRPEFAGQLRHEDFCTVMQSVQADDFRGKRLKFSGRLRTENARTGATLWFRIDGPKGTLLFDNLEQRQPDGPLTGTMGWAERHVVFEVSEEAVSLHYGFFLKGGGKCWSRGFALDEVDASVPTDSRQGAIRPRPTNLDFGGAAPN